MATAIQVPVLIAGASSRPEKRLDVIESIQNAGAIDILLVNQALAAARGAGVRVEESRGRLVVTASPGSDVWSLLVATGASRILRLSTQCGAKEE